MASTPTFVSTPNVVPVQILNADASAQKSLIVAGSSGTKVTSVIANSNDTTARVLELSILRSATNYLIAAVTVPANAGTDGTTVAVDLLNAVMSPGIPIDNDGTHYILLKSGDTLQVKSQTTVTTAKTVNVIATGADF